MISNRRNVQTKFKCINYTYNTYINLFWKKYVKSVILCKKVNLITIRERKNIYLQLKYKSHEKYFWKKADWCRNSQKWNYFYGIMKIRNLEDSDTIAFLAEDETSGFLWWISLRWNVCTKYWPSERLSLILSVFVKSNYNFNRSESYSYH